MNIEFVVGKGGIEICAHARLAFKAITLKGAAIHGIFIKSNNWLAQPFGISFVVNA